MHSGVGGDRVTGGGAGPIDVRLPRDVVAYKPTVMTIMLGMNDGSYRAFDQKYLRHVYRWVQAHHSDRERGAARNPHHA